MPQGSKNTDPPAEPDQVARRRIELGAAAHRGMEVAPSSSNFTPLWNNPVTMAGMFLAIVALLGLLTFALFQFVAPSPNPYVDIVGYLVIPGILILGLLVMPLGVLWRSWRMRRRDPTFRLAFGFPRVDLNDPIQRRAAKVVVGGTFILLPAVGVSSYHGYHYTDSTEFCSKACHVVMEPQAVTYAQSGHARVSHRFRGELVCQIQALGHAPGNRGLAQQLLPADPSRHSAPAPGARDLRAVPLAGEVLRRPVGGTGALCGG